MSQTTSNCNSAMVVTWRASEEMFRSLKVIKHSLNGFFRSGKVIMLTLLGHVVCCRCFVHISDGWMDWMDK